MKISFGQSLLQTGSTLHLQSLSEIYQMIVTSNSDMANLSSRIRKLYSINVEAYQAMKKKLPYICASEFTYGQRKKSAFVNSHGWLVDIDKIDSPSKQIELLTQLQAYPGIVLIYQSPSGTGIKCLVKLEAPISNAIESETAFKNYMLEMAEQLNISDFIDFKTYDVTRVSFLCIDENAWVNFDKKGIVAASYLPEVTLLPWDEEVKNSGGEKNQLSDDIYAKIREKLNPNGPKPKAKNVVFNVPEPLWEVLPYITEQVGLLDLQLEHRTIAYGLKLTFKYKHQFADVNLFFGKRGFTIVQTPTKGSHPELLEIGKNIIQGCVESYNQLPCSARLEVSYNSGSL